VRVGVVSPYALSRKGLGSLITSTPDMSLELELPSVPEDLEILRQANLDILVLHTDGRDLDAVSRLRKLIPTTRILLFLDNADEDMELAALRAGAAGCVTRNIDPTNLIKAFQVIGKGDLWMSHHVASRAITELTESDNADSATPSELTPREWQVLALLAKGSRNKDIANSLSVSENTVKTHLGVIYRKINVDCRLAATLYYFRHASSQEGPSPQSSSHRARRNKSVGRSGQSRNAPPPESES